MYVNTLFERYLPGLDASLLTDEQWVKKYQMLLYILKSEGINYIKLKGMGGG